MGKNCHFTHEKAETETETVHAVADTSLIADSDSADIEQNINIVILSKVYKNKYLPDFNSLKLFYYGMRGSM